MKEVKLTPFILKTSGYGPYIEYLDRPALDEYLKNFGFQVEQYIPNSGTSFACEKDGYIIWLTGARGWATAYLDPELNRYTKHRYHGRGYESLETALNFILSASN